MISNFTPQPYELHAFTADKRRWLVLGWTTTDAGARPVAAAFRDLVITGGPPVVIDAASFVVPASLGCTCA